MGPKLNDADEEESEMRFALLLVAGGTLGCSHPDRTDNDEFETLYGRWRAAVYDRDIIRFSTIAIKELGEAALPGILRKMDDPAEGVFGVALAKAVMAIKRWPETDFPQSDIAGQAAAVRERLRIALRGN